MRPRTTSAMLLSLSGLACTSTATVGQLSATDAAPGDAPLPGITATDAATLDATTQDAPVNDAEASDTTPPDDANSDATALPEASAECVEDTDCPPGRLCAEGTCVQCVSAAQCTDPEDIHCSDQGLCVECFSSDECTAGQVCAPWGECELACSADAQCVSSLRCDDTHRVCLQCLSDRECTNAGQFCDEGVCEPCGLDDDC